MPYDLSDQDQSDFDALVRVLAQRFSDGDQWVHVPFRTYDDGFIEKLRKAVDLVTPLPPGMQLRTRSRGIPRIPEYPEAVAVEFYVGKKRARPRTRDELVRAGEASPE